MRFPAKTPQFIKRLFPNYVWDFSFNTKTIYLTFDDGPTPKVTNWVLKLLKDYNAKATFFCIGDNIKKHPDIFKCVILEGHSIGNHTYNHLKGWQTSTKMYLDNVMKCEEVMNDAFRVQSEQSKINNQKSSIVNRQSPISNLFRPPYGQITPKLGKQLLQKDYTIIMWDIIAYDWDNSISSQQCLKNVINNVTDGSIVVLHDSIKASKHLYYVLPKLLEHFSKQGFCFKAIPYS